MKKNKLLNYIVCIISFMQMTGCMTFTDNKGFGINYDRRTAGTVVDDQALALRANAVLTKDKELWKNCHINTLSYNNSILLVGQASTEELKDRASKLLTPYIKSEQIYNQITIGDPTTFTTRAKDSWITTQVKGRILANKNIGINRTKIITEDGVVYLMGILTKEEEDLATSIASQTKDVKQVIKITTEHERYNRT
jgi:osmotically-inducible protein OsmY